jgi:YebC/PmpR family DNA-binding regulatory protein
MSGHSHWATIKHKKGAADAKRGRLWSKIARMIIVAAKSGGGDPNSNLTLRYSIDKAKAANMPKDTIDKAIKRGTGEIEGAVYEEIQYEGYGPGGVAILVETQTDNKNRTAAEVRHTFSKHNGKLGSTGCVSYLFARKGLIVLDGKRCDPERAMEVAIEAGADDVDLDDEAIAVTTEMENLAGVTQALREAQLPIQSSEMTLVPATSVRVEGNDARTLLNLINALDDLDDVARVSANFDIDDADLAAMSDE